MMSDDYVDCVEKNNDKPGSATEQERSVMESQACCEKLAYRWSRPLSLGFGVDGLDRSPERPLIRHIRAASRRAAKKQSAKRNVEMRTTPRTVRRARRRDISLGGTRGRSIRICGENEHYWPLQSLAIVRRRFVSGLTICPEMTMRSKGHYFMQ